MSQAARDVVGAVGDIKNRCDLLLRHLADVESQVSGYERYDDEVETSVSGAASGWGGAATHYLDNAIASVDEMLRQIFTALEAVPANRRR